MSFPSNFSECGRPSFMVAAVSAAPGIVELSLCGELDSVVASGLVSQVKAVLPEGEGFRVNLDLGALTFVDVAGARALATLHRACEARGCVVVLVAESAALINLLSLLGCPADWLMLTTDVRALHALLPESDPYTG
ncbi:STAS domain-containing protein [Actinoplanes sp. NPDC049316]|uniref:STAS domain-containing protein n=1 Tax=Actinoplanes sp. NPDC049316 TaxID=3154727 RepID=UPI0034493CEA